MLIIVSTRWKRTKDIEESQEGLFVTKIKGKECFKKLTMSTLHCGKENDSKVSITFNNSLISLVMEI